MVHSSLVRQSLFWKGEDADDLTTNRVVLNSNCVYTRHVTLPHSPLQEARLQSYEIYYGKP